MKTIKTVFTLLIFFTFTACINNDYDIGNVNTEIMFDDYSLVAPIGKVDVNIEELLEKFKVEHLYIEDNTLYLGYQNTFSIDAMDFVSIEADAIQAQYQFPPGTGTQFETTEKFRLNAYSDASNTQIDSIRLKNSTLKLHVNSTLSSQAELTLSFPNSNLQTTPAPAKFTINPGSNDLSLIINDKSIIAIQTDAQGCYFEMLLALKTTTPILLTPTDVSLNISFENIDYDVIWGLFPEISEFEATGDFELDFFKEILPEGSVIYLTDPSIKCSINNYNGIGLSLNLDYIKARKRDGSEVALDFNGSPSTIISVNPAVTPYQSVCSTVTFDRNYGKLNEILNTNLENIAFSFTAGTKTDNTTNQFLLKDKNLDIDLDVKVPLSFDKGSILLAKDTLKMDIASLPSEVKLEDLLLRLNYANKLPVKAKLGVEFLDSNKNTISTIKPKSYVLNSATVDNSGLATSETEGLINVKFNNAELSSIPKIKYLTLKTEVTGATSDSRISFSAKDYIRFKVDIFVKGDFILNKK